jgi:hypothetical protein
MYIRNLSIDYSEITLDSLFDDAVVREIPIVKTVVAAVKIGIAYREKYFLKKLLVFLSEINKGDINTENIIAFREKMQRDKKYRDKVITMISVLLDKFVDDKKAKILGRLFKAYAEGTINWVKFIELSSCLDLVFVSDFIVLKYLYDRRDGDMIHIETFSDATIDSSSFESAVTRLNAIGAVLVEAMADVGDSIHLGRHTKITQLGIVFYELGFSKDISDLINFA